MLATFARRFAASSAGVGGAYVAYKVYQDGTFDLYNVGAARFGRAAFTVS